MVVGSMVGAGVFSLPGRFAQETGVAGALIAWTVAGAGMLMLAFVFQRLAIRRPDLDGSVYSRHARRREDVGRATVLGFLSVFAVFASVTIVSYGLMPMGEIAELRQPSMAGVLEHAVGTWGKVFVSVGLIISVLGAYLAWTLMSAEVLFAAAKDDDMPRFLGRSTAADVPVPALLMTTLLTQAVLVVTPFTQDAFNFALDLTSALTPIPFLLAAAFAVKIARGRLSGDLVIALLATVSTVFLLYAAGLKYLLVSFIIYAPATVLFMMARREQGRRLFSPRELVILVVSVAGAALGITALALGWISL
ncbi:amino acid permease [Streptomyces dengpaensis]|uniref:Amino acid permease n=2 Tax=Streptomyces TaxID=1883 RepID=A0ABM6T3D2_9ACTN|nr:amino acid permease [Streptomyces dengpaensis]